jgi:hypothetical protein
MGRLVDDAGGCGDVPQPADVGLALQALEVNAVELEILGDRKTRNTGTDHASHGFTIRHA